MKKFLFVALVAVVFTSFLPTAQAISFKDHPNIMNSIKGLGTSH